MFTKAFWMDTAERAFWTFGQTFVAVLTIDSAANVGVSWGQKLAGAAIAAAISVGKSVFIGRNIGNSNSASTLPTPTV